MKNPRLRRVLITLGIVSVALVLLYVLRAALTPLFLAIILAYLLDPVIDRMEARKLNRSASILILAGVATVVVGIVGVFLVFQAQREIGKVIKDMPAYIERVQSQAVPFAKERFDIDLPQTVQEVVEEARRQLSEIDPASLKPVSAVASRIFSSTMALVGWTVGILVVPVFLFYILRDWDTLKYQALEFVPLPYQGYVKDRAQAVDEVLGAFLRGQATVALILGVLYSIGLVFLGIDLAVLIGMGAGILFIVPYLGTILGVVAASIMALLEFGVDWHILGVWGVFALVQTFEGTLLTPNIMGEKVGLSPVIVILSLMIGTELMGLLGMLVSVPIAAVLKVFIRDGLDAYQRSDYFHGPPKPPENAAAGPAPEKGDGK